MESRTRLVELSVLSIAQACKNRLKLHYGERLESVVLYGSAARGEMAEASDIDLLVLLSHPLDYFGELNTIVDLLYPLQFESSHWISAKPAAASEFAAGTIQLYRNAKEEGIVL